MNIEEIQKLISGKLRGKRKTELESHINSDTELKELYLILKKLSESSLSHESSLAEAAKKLSGKLFKDFQKAFSQKSKKLGVQFFDSSLLPLPEGIRPAAVDTKTLKFKIGIHSVELTLYPITIDSVELIGVVDFQTNEPVSAELKTRKRSFTTELDRYLLFRFERIPVGKSKLSFYQKKKLLGSIEFEI